MVDELLKYCEIDTIALAEILIIFHEKFHNLFKINVSKYPTLPSLVFAGYRTSYMDNENIPKILSKNHDFIKQSFYGGITDAYKPFAYNVNSYDVNSLYPYVMRENYFPVGELHKFKGKFDILNSDYLGYVKVKVNAPINLKYPTLPHHMDTGDGIRTIFPVGS